MMYLPKDYNRKELNEKKKLKKILINTNKGKFSVKDLPDGQVKFLNDNCPVNTCEIVRDQNQREIADAIIFKVSLINLCLLYNESYESYD